jgi:DNA helicase-2/ATP-dependent DNA helicase PcrA
LRASAICEQKAKRDCLRFWRGHVIRMDYLSKLNPDQRAAVEHGVADADPRPLLIIAGAGSGKTDTLAHRVAHLVMNGADPHRILLLTFSRRAAAEMARRTERILNRASGTNASAGLVWSGTFHAIGARFLREYAEHIGLDRAFTIHDREDAADLMNLVRHELDLSRTESRFPQKGTCLSIYSRAGERRNRARRNSRKGVSVVRELDRRAEDALRRLC